MSQIVQIAYIWICFPVLDQKKERYASLFKQLKFSTLKAGFTSILISYLPWTHKYVSLMFRNPSHPVSNISFRITRLPLPPYLHRTCTRLGEEDMREKCLPTVFTMQIVFRLERFRIRDDYKQRCVHYNTPRATRYSCFK